MTDIAEAKPVKRKETPGEIARSFVFMVLLALIFRSVAYEPFHIPSGSMLSTLYEGDYIFVSKLSYGYSRYSFPFRPNLFDGRILASEPKRGDVAVFRNPQQPKVDYIKRIIGLPGDTVQMKHGRLYLNGQMVEQTRKGEAQVPDGAGGWRQSPMYEEILPGGSKHIVLDDVKDIAVNAAGFDPDNTGIYTVPAGHYFMMGDNRDHSQDSRFSPELGFESGPGFIPFENFVGRAEVIAFSMKGLSGRMFKAIH